MNHSSLKYVVVAIVLIGGGLAATNNDTIRCVLTLPCSRITTDTAPEYLELTATTTIPVATTTATIAATTTIKSTPETTKTVKVTTVTPATPQSTVTTITQVTTVIVPPVVEEGPTTFYVSAIPLLFGGNVGGGGTVPVSYLKIVNRGSYSARLKGFWVRQNGNAPARTVIGLSSVDDKGGSRGYTGAIEGSTPFNDDLAFVPTDAIFLPGQMRLFTIKATLSSNITDYIGMELKIDVTSINAQDVTLTGSFPIRGTTWTLSQ